MKTTMTEPRAIRTETRELSNSIHAAIGPGRLFETAADCSEYAVAAGVCRAPVPFHSSASYVNILPHTACPNVCPCFRRRT